MGKNITIYDVAREAGVSLATVSRVINASDVVKAKTRDRVLETIQRLDFKPNQIARGLATSKTTTIAIVFPQLMFARVKDMISGVGDTSHRLDYNISMYTTDEIGDGDPIVNVIERVIKSRADGVILFSSQKIDEEIELMNKYKLPAVVIGSRVSSECMGSIFVDASAMAYEIIDKYLKKGKKKILFVTSEECLFKTDEMILGIENAYRDHGLTFDRDHQVLSSSERYEESYSKFLNYLKVHQFDLVLTSSDETAIAVMNACHDHDIQIPKDIEVIGMMNTNQTMMVRPTLSSVNIPVYDMGALAIRLLTKILNEEEIDTKEVEVQYLLMERETTQ